MKKVLFISATNYDFKERSLIHLEKKFLGLSRGMNSFVLAKGRPFHVKKWNTEFYLFPSNLLLWPVFLIFGFLICFTKKIDTIISQSPLIEGFTGSIIKFFLRKELIVELHGDWKTGPFISKKRRFEFIEKRFIPFLAKLSFKRADKIRGVADYLINEAKIVAKEKKYFKFHTFTDLSIFLNEKNISYEKFILFAGGLEKVKGVKYLIEAFSKIGSFFKDFKLVVIGDGSEKQELVNLVSKFNLTDKIYFKGRLSLEETKDIMKDCYLFVLPSLSEGLPRVLMEAMAMKKAVIASRVGGIPEIVRDNETGFLFEKEKSEDLAQKLKILLQDKNLSKSMGQKARHIAQTEFSNEQYIKNYISMIND